MFDAKTAAEGSIADASTASKDYYKQGTSETMRPLLTRKNEQDGCMDKTLSIVPAGKRTPLSLKKQGVQASK